MKLKNLSLFLLILSLIPTVTFAQISSKEDSIELFLKQKMGQLRIPALQIAIINDGKVVMNKSFGVANLENNIAAKNESIFSINSITKAFTGVAIMQLAEEGKLKVTDPISLYLDSLPVAWQKITLQQLLTHISGLPDVLNAEEQVMGHNDEAQAMREVKKLPIEFPVGDRFRYNQTGYVLLGQVITKLSGMHFTKFIEEKQFKVAGMKLTRFGDSYDVIPNYAGAYTMTKQVGNDFVRNASPGIAYMQFPVFFRTAAGIQSTATDMANWIISLKSGQLLKQKKSLETMWTPAILNNGSIGGFNGLTNGYALGWPTVSRPRHPAVAPVGGGRSAFFIYLKDDLSIVVLTNLMGGNPDRFIDEIAGYYIPEIREAIRFQLPSSIQKLRTQAMNKGFNDLARAVKELKRNDPSFSVTENELNTWGYKLLSQNKAADALAVFKYNVQSFPTSANAYDSLGEILELMEDKAAALESYKKSFALDPKNKNAAERIKVLEGR